jgi:hypothetical protein
MIIFGSFSPRKRKPRRYGAGESLRPGPEATCGSAGDQGVLRGVRTVKELRQPGYKRDSGAMLEPPFAARTLALGEAERNIPECVPVTTLDGVNVPDGRNARNWERHMPREFTSEKALEHHTELTGDTYLMEGTATFAARQRLLSPGQ